MKPPHTKNDGPQPPNDTGEEPAPANRPKREYEVGYGRTPEHTRFVKGKSGNPNGRKPGVKNIATLLKAALDEMIVVKEGGRSRRVTRREAILRLLVSTSLTADLNAFKLLLPLMQQLDAASEQQTERGHSADDEAVLKALSDQFGGREGDDDQS